MKKIKKFTAGLLAAGLLIGSPSFSVKASPLTFTDFPETEWYAEAVMEMTDLGIIKGLTPTTFGPMLLLNRAQMVTMLYRAGVDHFGKYEEVAFKPIYPDVQAGLFYSEPITWGYETGIATGYENGYFGPANKITREQFLVMLFRMDAQIYGEFDNTYTFMRNPDYFLNQYPDGMNVSRWARKAFAWAIEYGIITGKETATGKKLDPIGNTSRAEAAMILKRWIHAYPDGEL